MIYDTICLTLIRKLNCEPNSQGSSQDDTQFTIQSTLWLSKIFVSY